LSLLLLNKNRDILLFLLYTLFVSPKKAAIHRHGNGVNHFVFLEHKIDVILS
jgi:hypothetical protein